MVLLSCWPVVRHSRASRSRCLTWRGRHRHLHRHLLVIVTSLVPPSPEENHHHRHHRGRTFRQRVAQLVKTFLGDVALCCCCCLHATCVCRIFPFSSFHFLSVTVIPGHCHIDSIPSFVLFPV